MALMYQSRHCELCGARIKVKRGKEPRTWYFGSSGIRTIRVLRVDRDEIHRCEILPSQLS